MAPKWFTGWWPIKSINFVISNIFQTVAIFNTGDKCSFYYFWMSSGVLSTFSMQEVLNSILQYQKENKDSKANYNSMNMNGTCQTKYNCKY